MSKVENLPSVDLFDYSNTSSALVLDTDAGYLTLNGLDLCRVNEKMQQFYGRIMTQSGHVLDPFSLRRMDISSSSLTNSTNNANSNLLNSIGYTPFQLGNFGARLHTVFKPELSEGADLSTILKNATIDQIVDGGYLTQLDADILGILNRVVGKTYTFESIVSELSENGSRAVDRSEVVKAIERIRLLKVEEKVRQVSRFAFRGTESEGVFFWNPR